MKLDALNALDKQARLVIHARLKPLAGTRFQPTGFPDLGAAQYKGPNGNDMLLVESAQSMANRLEAVCWDEAQQKPVDLLDGMPYVESTLPDGTKTNSLLEAHRLNSPYIVNSKKFSSIKKSIGFKKDQPFDRRRLAKALFHFDPCSLIHGIFLEKIGGVVRLPRALSAFIEATKVQLAQSGGAKFDRVQPGTGESTPYGKADKGYGNVIYHREEFCGQITAYFILDLALIRGFGLGKDAEALLTALSLFKILRFLRVGLRLRTACDLEVDGNLEVKRPSEFALPSLKEIENALPTLIQAAADKFASPPKTVVTYLPSKKSAKASAGKNLTEQSDLGMSS